MCFHSDDAFAEERSYIRIPKAEHCSGVTSNLAKILADGVALDLYGKELTGSVTSFEQYRSMPVSRTSASYGLGAG